MAQNINLHSSGRRRRAPVSQAGAMALAAAVIVAAGTLYALEGSRQAQLRVGNLETERAIARLEKQLGAAPNATRQALEDLTKAEAEVVALEAVAAQLSSGLLGRTTGFTGPLRALASGKTDGVWLTGIHFDNAGAQVALEGKAIDAARVPALIERLRRLPPFAGTAIATIELKPAEEAGQLGPLSLVRFRIATPKVEAATPAGSKP